MQGAERERREKAGFPSLFPVWGMRSIQLPYVLTQLTPAAVWRTDCGARLEVGRPASIFHRFNLEIMVGI